MNDLPNIIHCWPTKWLEAAAHAGFAIYKGDGRWEFLNEGMRGALQEFASAIQKAEGEAIFGELREFSRTLGKAYTYNGPQTALQEAFVDECEQRVMRSNA